MLTEYVKTYKISSGFVGHFSLEEKYYKILAMDESIEKLAQDIEAADWFEGKVLKNEVLAPRTSMKVGGPADLFIEPATLLALVNTVCLCKDANLPIFVLGGGSNLVVNDGGIRGVTISISNLKNFHIKPGKAMECTIEDFEQVKESCPMTVSCGSGMTMEDLLKNCSLYGITGLEKFAGLPGTVGGATYMNARCYEENIGDAITSVKYLDLNEVSKCDKFNINSILKTYTHYSGTDDWDYKKSPFQNMKCIIVEVSFLCKGLDLYINEGCTANPAIQDYINKKYEYYIEDRKSKGHFKAASAGSVFKNNHSFGKPSGKIIDEVGLKGKSIGGAQVAPWHGNFIINNGEAKAEDIRKLVDFVKEKVFENTGFNLEEEIIFV